MTMALTNNDVILVDKYERIQAGAITINTDTYPVYKGVNIVGRNRSANVNLKNVSVSVQHAIITIVDEKQHYISDIKSSNGTTLSLLKLQPFKMYELLDGAEVVFGGLAGTYKKVVHQDKAVLEKAEECDNSFNLTQGFYGMATQTFINDTSHSLKPPDEFKVPDVPTNDINDEENIHDAPTQVYSTELETTNIHDAATQVYNPINSQSPLAPNDCECNDFDGWDAGNVTKQSLEKNHQEDLDRLEQKLMEVDASITENLKDANDTISRLSSNNRFSIAEIEESVYEESSVLEPRSADLNNAATTQVYDSINSAANDCECNDVNTVKLPELNNGSSNDLLGTQESQLHVSQLKRRNIRRVLSDSVDDINFSQVLPDSLNEDSNESIDLLNGMEHSQLQVGQLKQRVVNRILSDTIEDCDDKAEEAVKQSNIESDSDTDIEEVIVANEVKRIDISDSDIETRKEDKIESGSDTDADEEIVQKALENSNRASLGMDDSDFIPATQEVCTGEANKKQNSQDNTQGSFKLGLTELMLSGQSENKIVHALKNVPKIHSSQEPSTSKQLSSAEMLMQQDLNGTGTSEVSMDALYLSNTEKTQETTDADGQRKFTFKKASYNVIETNLSALENKDDDIYSMNTQRLADDAVFAAPTQEAIKKLDDRRIEEDIFDMPTQKFDTSSKKTDLNKNEGNRSPRKTGSNKSKTTDSQELKNKTEYASMDKLIFPRKPSASGEVFEDMREVVYDMPTQKLVTPEKTNTNKVKDINALQETSPNKSSQTEDIFDAPTQKLITPTSPAGIRSKNSWSQIDRVNHSSMQTFNTPTQTNNNTSKKGLENEVEDDYDAPTQKLLTPTSPGGIRSKNSWSQINRVNDSSMQAFDTPTQTSNNTSKKDLKNAVNDDYDAPTQKLITPSKTGCSKNKSDLEDALEDVYDAPTQKLTTPKKSVLYKSKASLEDVYDAPTQKLITPRKTSDNKNKRDLENVPEDVFDAPTQKLVTPTKTSTDKNESNQSGNLDGVSDDVFDAPTQQLITPSTMCTNKSKSDQSEYLNSYQQTLSTPQKTGGNNNKGDLEGVPDDVFDAPTQQLITPSKMCTNKSDQSENLILSPQELPTPQKTGGNKNKGDLEGVPNDVFDAPTQQLITPSTLGTNKSKSDQSENLNSSAHKQSTPQKTGGNKNKRDLEGVPDDVFDAPTQQLITPKKTGGRKRKSREHTKNKDVFDAPTQKLITPNKADAHKTRAPKQKQITTNNEDFDINDASTQPMFSAPSNRNSFDTTMQTLTATAEMTNDSLTQKLQVMINPDDTSKNDAGPTSPKPFYNNTQCLLEELADAPQKNSQDVETQIEADFPSQNVRLLSQDDSRPKNPLCAVLNDSEEFEETRSGNRRSSQGAEMLSKRNSKRPSATAGVTLQSKRIKVDESRKVCTNSEVPDNKGKRITKKTVKDVKIDDAQESSKTMKDRGEGQNLYKVNMKGDTVIDDKQEINYNSDQNEQRKSNLKLKKLRSRRTTVHDIKLVSGKQVDNKEKLSTRTKKLKSTEKLAHNELGNKDNDEQETKEQKESSVNNVKSRPSRRMTDKETNVDEHYLEVGVPTKRTRCKSRASVKISELVTVISEYTQDEPKKRARSRSKLIQTLQTDGSGSVGILKDDSLSKYKQKRRIHADDDINEGDSHKKTRIIQSEFCNEPKLNNNSASFNTSEMIMSTVDQSFAILEAKSAKTRKTKRADVSNAVEVSVTENRRSMTTASVDAVLANKEEDKVKKKRGRKSKTKTINDEPKPIRERAKKNLSDSPIFVKSSSSVVVGTPERSKRKMKDKVVFTMLDSPELESIVRQLGGSLVDSVDACTVLVTGAVKRSLKLLSAVAQGKPICSVDWLKDSKKHGDFLDPWNYIVQDVDAESKWNFKLRDSLARARNNKLLENYVVQLFVPAAQDVLKGAIEASGGKCLRGTPKLTTETLLVVSVPENKSKYTAFVKKYPGTKVVEPEAIFDGVLRQELRLENHLLK